MKAKLTILLLMLLPLALTAQKKDKSVAKFYNEYSNYPNYSFLEVNEGMFKLFQNMEGLDAKMIALMKKLKLVRMLEFIPGTVSVQVKSSNLGTVTSSFLLLGAKGEQEQKTVVSRGGNTGTIAMINNSILYDRVMAEIDFNSYAYTTLMKSNQDGVKMSFLRRVYTRSTDSIDQEFLLINGNTMIQIRGNINIVNLVQMEDILKAIGEILPQ